MTNTEFVTNLFEKVLFRSPVAEELSNLATRLDNGLLTRQGLVEAAYELPVVKTYPYQISAIYQAIFNKLPNDEQLSIWGGLYLQGLTLPQIAQQMLNSSAASASFPQLNNTAAVFNQLAQNVLGRELIAPELDYVASALLQGQTQGQLIELLIGLPEAIANNQAQLIKNLLWQAATQTDATPEQLDALPNTASDFAVQLMQLPDSEYAITNYWESAGTLYANTEWIAPVNVNLITNTLSVGDLPQSLTTGVMNSAINIDFSRLIPDSESEPEEGVFAVTIKADDQANRITASAAGTHIEAGAGNDIITLAAGSDRIQFAVDALSNGYDIIDQFTLGQDQLDFSRFLNKNIGSVNLRTGLSTDTQASYWVSGDLLVAQGNTLTTSTSVANLFGEGRVFANPTGPSKAVVLTTNVTGDTYVWFVENTQDTSITSNEAKLVAVLNDVNNLLDQVNITSLQASMQISQAPGKLYYSRGFVTESANNDGSVSAEILITLQGDTFTGVVGQAIGSVNNLPAGLKASLIKLNENQAKLSISGKATKHGTSDSIDNLTVSFAANNFTSGSLALDAVKDDLMMLFMDVNLSESGGNLNVSGLLPSSLMIDLTNDQAWLGNSPILPLFGSLVNVNTVNLAAVTSTSASITVLGDSDSESFIAAPIGGRLQGNDGNDNYLLGTGKDVIVFESRAADNGIDNLFNFKIGSTSDQLDFTAFLNKPSLISTVIKQGSGNSVAWANGNIMMVQGDFTNPQQQISGLFGSDVAAPTAQAKAVIIAANLTGDATVWYVTNQSGANINTIEQAEVEQVATLVGINNLSLVPMNSVNFV